MKKQSFATIEEGFFNFVTDYVNQPKVETTVIPKGGIIIWSGAANAIPVGWALCDGTNNTPDLRGRFVLGGVAGSGFNSIGNKSGASEITLQPFNLPPHTHSGTTNSDGAHTHTMGSAGNHSHSYGRAEGILWGKGFAVHDHGLTGNVHSLNAAGDHTHTINTTNSNHSHNFTTNEGNQQTKSTPINILPPYYALAYIMKL
jgi:microcystin-dependent protein